MSWHVAAGNFDKKVAPCLREEKYCAIQSNLNLNALFAYIEH